jgi:ABC-type branched-subunit amino acid transport system substrate-binding protein
VRGEFLSHVGAPKLLDPPRCGDDGEPVGERVSLSYDAAMLVVQAVERLGGRLRPDQSQRWDTGSINPVAVHAEIVGRNRVTPFAGVSGQILFQPDNGEPRDKRISLLQVQSIPDLHTTPREVFHCGVARLDGNPDPSCGQ